MKNRIKSTSGFSIIETLIAMAILSIVSFVFMHWVDMSYKSLANVSETNEVSNAMSRLKAAFGDDDRACTAMLGGKSFGEGTVKAIGYYDYENQAQGRPFVLDESNRSNPAEFKHFVLNTDPNAGLGVNGKRTVTVERIDLIRISELGPFSPASGTNLNQFPPGTVLDAVLFEISVKFKKSDKAMGPDITRKIPLYALATGSTIVRCSVSAISDYDVEKRICDIKGGGSSYVDFSASSKLPAGQRCVEYPNLVWRNGHSPLTAACGPGEIPAERLPPYPPNSINDILGSKVCEANTAVGSYVAPRSYAGVPDADNSYAAKGTLSATGVCTFAYQTGVSTTGFVGRIHCKRP